jgi:hypothetical protein
MPSAPFEKPPFALQPDLLQLSSVDRRGGCMEKVRRARVD